MEFIKSQLLDSKKAGKRTRHILANSGDIMESGDVRDVQNLYVMGTDAKLIKVADLAKADKQTESYMVKAQADHGEYIDGELVPSVEKIFGSCRVWLESDGLHATVYFADDDELADHAWAISEDASWSTGIDWFPDGYFGAGYEITEPIGILREVSMVLTGNDPRAHTIDTKPNSEAQRSEIGDGEQNKLTKGESEMTSKDSLTADERDAVIEKITAAIDEFVETAPVEETESKDEGEAPAEAPAEEKKDSLHMPVVVVRDRIAKQESKVSTDTNWIKSREGRSAYYRCLAQGHNSKATADALWRAELKRHNVTTDAIQDLPTPGVIEQIFIDTLEKSDGIISHFRTINTKSFRVNTLYETTADNSGRAQGHKKGDTKVFQDLTDAYRDVLCKMVYKKLDLDALEMYENPELVEYRAQELVNAIIVEIERAAISGDGREEASPDLRMFDGTRGFYSIAADAAATSGAGQYLATSVDAGSNLYDSVVTARGSIRTEGQQILIAKADTITAMLTAKATDGSYMIPFGASLEDILKVSRVYTPAWMDKDTTNDAYLLVSGAYTMIGQNGINTHDFFDTTVNQHILLDETPRGGSLAAYKSAVAIKAAA